MMPRFVTTVVGSLAEAAQEVRVHRGRILLSLIGIAVAITALVGSLAATTIVGQTMREQNESSGGRPAMVQMYVTPPQNPSVESIAAVEEAWAGTLARSEVPFGSRRSSTETSIRFPDGSASAYAEVVDQPYAEMFRVRTAEGTWFAPGDGDRRAPAIVVNRAFWERLGSPALATHPTVTSPTLGDGTLVVIGVYTSSDWDTEPGYRILTQGYRMLATPAQQVELAQNMSYSAWVPAEIEADLSARLQQSVSAAAGDPLAVSVSRNDYQMQGMEDPAVVFRLIGLAIGGVILLLGALGLVNITLVSVRQRIREIGVRRAFGATRGRVFFSVMLESVVGTLIAGVVGIIVAVLIVQNSWVQGILTSGLTVDSPAFPMDAAIAGVIISVVVGALAGLIPALVAVKVKVIDAIRF